MKRISLFLAIVLCFGLFTGCAKQEENQEVVNVPEAELEEDTPELLDGPKEGGTFVASISREPQTYNPDAHSDDGAYPVIQNVFNFKFSFRYRRSSMS